MVKRTSALPSSQGSNVDLTLVVTEYKPDNDQDTGNAKAPGKTFISVPLHRS
jgi:hypothetical protein